MGDIGEPVRHIELEPFPDDVPATEPAPAPAEPAPAEQPQTEPVPA